MYVLGYSREMKKPNCESDVGNVRVIITVISHCWEFFVFDFR